MRVVCLPASVCARLASLYHAINTQVNPVAAGALTGGLFKAGAGVRGAAASRPRSAPVAVAPALPAGAALR